MTRRWLLIGDVHAEDVHLALALGHAADVDGVLCVGDIVDGHGDVRRCMELLRSHGARVVRGNHDRWAAGGKGLDPAGYPDDVVAWLGTLPAVDQIDTPAGPLLLCHGMGTDDMTRLLPEDSGYAIESNFALQRVVSDGVYPLVVCGHTHRRMVRRFGTTTVINAGTLKRGYNPCFAILDLGARRVEVHTITPEPAVTAAEVVALG